MSANTKGSNPLPHIACLLWLQFAHAGAAAQEELLVTGTYSPQPAITSTLTVIGADEIAAANKRSLAELLKTVPGLLVEEQGGPGGLTAVSIRGGEANFTLVLLDGVPVNDPTNSRGGGFDFADLNAALVERVEVVRGAQSAVYGSDAVAGVINIITRRPERGHAQSLNLEAGEDDFGRIGFSAQGATASFDYSAELGRRDEGEPVAGSERESDSANLRLGWRPGDAHTFALAYRYLDGERNSYPEQSGGPELALTDDLDAADYSDELLYAAWAFQFNRHWRSELRASRFEREEEMSSPGIPPFFEVPPNGADTHFERGELRWVNTVDGGEGYRLDLGADYRREEGESIGYVQFGGFRTPTDFELERDIAAAFANLNATVAEGLLLDGGMRYDEPEGFAGETSWHLGGSWEATAWTTLSANWGEGYKLPSFFALGHGLVGNPELLPERSETWDISVNWRPAQYVSLAGTWFANDFTDLIDFDDETFRNVNRNRVETRGVELEATVALTDNFSVRANGTWTDIDVKGEDTVLTGRPEWAAGLLLQMRLARNWESVLDYRYSGKQWATSRHSGEAVSEQLSDYHRVDWVLAWSPSPRWQCRLSIDNLLDEGYETAVGFGAPGRALRFGLTFNN